MDAVENLCEEADWGMYRLQEEGETRTYVSRDMSAGEKKSKTSEKNLKRAVRPSSLNHLAVSESFRRQCRELVDSHEERVVEAIFTNGGMDDLALMKKKICLEISNGLLSFMKNGNSSSLYAELAFLLTDPSLPSLQSGCVQDRAVATLPLLFDFAEMCVCYSK